MKRRSLKMQTSPTVFDNMASSRPKLIQQPNKDRDKYKIDQNTIKELIQGLRIQKIQSSNRSTIQIGNKKVQRSSIQKDQYLSHYDLQTHLFKQNCKNNNNNNDCNIKSPKINKFSVFNDKNNISKHSSFNNQSIYASKNGGFKFSRKHSRKFTSSQQQQSPKGHLLKESNLKISGKKMTKAATPRLKIEQSPKLKEQIQDLKNTCTNTANFTSTNSVNNLISLNNSIYEEKRKKRGNNENGMRNSQNMRSAMVRSMHSSCMRTFCSNSQKNTEQHQSRCLLTIGQKNSQKFAKSRVKNRRANNDRQNYVDQKDFGLMVVNSVHILSGKAGYGKQNYHFCQKQPQNQNSNRIVFQTDKNKSYNRIKSTKPKIKNSCKHLEVKQRKCHENNKKYFFLGSSPK